MTKSFKEVMMGRRSYYGITGEATISDERIVEIVKETTKYVPSAFNSQSQRAVVLLGESHQKLWRIVMETLRGIMPSEKFGPTEIKINSFAAGYGSILYFDETETTQGLAEKFPTYKETFPLWAEQANGMLQFAIWSQLEAEGLGANLQHYNPLIDEEVKREFDILKTWKLIAQMPFGKPSFAPGEKDFMSIEERVLVK